MEGFPANPSRFACVSSFYRYTFNGYFYPRLPMTNKPGTLTLLQPGNSTEGG